MTAVLWVGNKSLSHVLACIERTKNRLLDAGESEAARTQIIQAVMSYWSAHPGVALSIVEKLLNYGILSPATVIQWALVNYAGARRGGALAQAHVFELVFNTVVKVTNRLHQVILFPSKPANGQGADGDVDMANNNGAVNGGPPDETKTAEIKAMRDLFSLMDDSLVAWASGSKDEMIEVADDSTLDRERLVRRWGDRWARVFRRRAAMEEAFLLEAQKPKPEAETAVGGGAEKPQNGNGQIASSDDVIE